MILLAAVAICSVNAEEWRKVAFVGNAQVKSISGLVEVIAPGDERILRPGERALAGQTLRVWRGSEIILWMEGSQSLVRAKGPVIFRLAPEGEGLGRAAVTADDTKGFVVRAVRGGGKYQDGQNWRPLQPGLTLPEGAKVRAYRNATLDFYHPGTRTAYRVTDHKKQTALAVRIESSAPAETVFAAKAP